MPHLVATLRPPFLLLTPACMSVGVAASGVNALDWRVWLAFACGLLAHAAVNGLNEVLDFRSGLDLETARTPFSGGSGTLPARPALAGPALRIACLALALSIVGGLVLVDRAGPGLLGYGLVGVVLVLAYTGPLNRNPIACLLAPGIGFGPVMVAGTAFALAGMHVSSAWAASVLPFALASNLLLVNQIPDIGPDRRAGRRHLLVVAGAGAAAPAYAVLAVVGWGGTALAVGVGALPPECLWSLLAFPAAVAVWRGLARAGTDTRRLMPWIALNVALTLVTPVLLAAALWSTRGA